MSEGIRPAEHVRSGSAARAEGRSIACSSGSAGTGFDYNDGRIVSTGHVTSFPHLITVAATAVLYLLKQLERIEASINENRWLAIGTAKEMVETICKTILADLGKSFDIFKEALQGTPAGTRRHPRPGRPEPPKPSSGFSSPVTIQESALSYGTPTRAKGLHQRHAPGGWCGFVACGSFC